MKVSDSVDNFENSVQAAHDARIAELTVLREKQQDKKKGGSVTNVEHRVIELCPYCDTEINMNWDVKKYGYKAFCSYCGNRLMLCDECMHGDDEGAGHCDYNSETDSCHFNPARKGDALKCRLFYCGKRKGYYCCRSCGQFKATPHILRV